jgi:hypothetical protein
MTRRHRLSTVLAVVALGAAARADAKPPKVLNLASCPTQGSESKGSSRGALNEVKKRVPPAGTPAMLTFADLPTLQQQADGLVKSGAKAKPSGRDRAKLRGLASPSGAFGEGDLVAMVGFMVGKPSINPGESANCYLTGAANNDFEFSIAPSADATPYEGVVAELIPQDRPAAWTIGRLRKLANDHRQVMVVGQLMFDTRHVPNPKRGTNHESPRVSTWEVHPVTKFVVCSRPAGGCDPTHDDQWQPLESIPER